jgi:hypothetical protein
LPVVGEVRFLLPTTFYLTVVCVLTSLLSRSVCGLIERPAQKSCPRDPSPIAHRSLIAFRDAEPRCGPRGRVGTVLLLR